MNLKLFGEMAVKRKYPRVRHFEWRVFLEFCERYLEDHEIKNPVVVELGIFRGHQKKFYEKLLGAEHIGIDISDRYLVPDILGDTHNPKTLAMLKKRLNGRTIDILFIDTCHTYKCVKKDFEMFSPLCTGIIGFHDIESGRYDNDKRFGVWRFWDELKSARYPRTEIHKKYVFATIHYAHLDGKDRGTLGIGIMMKK